MLKARHNYDSGWVYAFTEQPGAFTKIGVSWTDVQRRFRQVARQRKKPLRIVSTVYVEHGAMAMEQALHDLLKQFHYEDEWFAIKLYPRDLEIFVTLIQLRETGHSLDDPVLTDRVSLLSRHIETRHLQYERDTDTFGIYYLKQVAEGKVAYDLLALLHIAKHYHVSLDWLLYNHGALSLEKECVARIGHCHGPIFPGYDPQSTIPPIWWRRLLRSIARFLASL